MHTTDIEIPPASPPPPDPIPIRHGVSGGLGLHRAGAGAPLVLLHGGAGSWTHWHRAIAPLAAAFEVFAFDLPGMGLSDDLPNDGDLARFLDRLGAGFDAALGPGTRFRLAAFSVGAVPAAAYAARNAGRVRRMALLAPGGFDADEVQPLDMRGPAPGMSEAEIDAVHRHNLCAAMFADPARVDAETVRLQRYNVEGARYDSRKLGFGNHIKMFLPDVQCPLMMLWGTEDAFANPTVEPRIARLHALAPHAEIHRIEGAGHWVQQECPDAVNPILLDFLRGRAAGPSDQR